MVISFPQGPGKKMRHCYAVFNCSPPATGRSIADSIRRRRIEFNPSLVRAAGAAAQLKTVMCRHSHREL